MEPNMQLSIQLSGTGLDDLKPYRIQLEHKPLTDATLLFDRHLPPLQLSSSKDGSTPGPWKIFWTKRLRSISVSWS